jgi:hypothetical protein
MDSNCYNYFSYYWNWMAGVFKGAKKLGITPSNPAIKNVTEKARQFINNITNGK